MAMDIVKGPVGRVLGLVVWTLVFSLLVGAINGWYLQAVDAGVVSGERFDRVIPIDGDDSADEVWRGVTGVSETAVIATGANLVNTSAYKVSKGTGDTCVIANTAAAYAPPSDPAVTAYTPLGTAVRYALPTADVTEVTPITVDNCEWSEAGTVFGAGGLSGLIKILLQAGGLAPPIALLMALGSFGQAFMRAVGSHPILAAVFTAIGLLLMATLLNVFIPFLTGAFEAIDGNRFQMFSEGLGAVSVVVGNFFGVVLVASMMMVAWEVVKSLKGGNVLGKDGGQRM